MNKRKRKFKNVLHIDNKKLKVLHDARWHDELMWSSQLSGVNMKCILFLIIYLFI